MLPSEVFPHVDNIDTIPDDGARKVFLSILSTWVRAAPQCFGSSLAGGRDLFQAFDVHDVEQAAGSGPLQVAASRIGGLPSAKRLTRPARLC
jgi:hypothetical protein